MNYEKHKKKSISRFHCSFQNISLFHLRTEFYGSIIPFSKPINEEIILKVEQGDSEYELIPDYIFDID